MKKRFTLILASMFLTLGAWAQTLNFTFTRTDQVATVNVDGATDVTATIAISPTTYQNKGQTGGENNSILCIDQNTNAATETSPNSYTLTITNNSDQALSFDHILVSGVALNSDGAYQSLSTVRQRKFKVTCGETSLSAETLRICDDSHCNGTPTRHPFVASINIPAGEDYIVKVDIYTDGGSGCFYGLTSIVLGNYATLVDEAQAICDTPYSENAGSIGYYSEATLNALKTAKEADGELDRTKINNLLNAIDNMEIVLPTAGKFYRLKSVDGEYLSNTLNNTVQTSTATDATTIYYLEAGEAPNEYYLVSYGNGLYFTNPWRIGVGTEIIQGSEIYKQSVLLVEGIAAGKFAVNYGNSKAYYLTASGSATNYAENADDTNGLWAIEAVTGLSVTIGTSGYATLHAPVALTIPNGVKAYTGTLNDEWLTLNEVNTTIPANTAVILEGTANTYDFAVAIDVDAIEDNDLVGTIETVAMSGTPYTLQNHNGGVAFKQYTGTNLTGFKAYLTLPEATEAQAIRITRGGDEETTGIEDAELTIDNGQLTIYDLQGRRVQQMEKGIYIVNGKKVVK